ncbi:hypothetical protein ACDX78_13745 [Virgibacillus oceani]
MSKEKGNKPIYKRTWFLLVAFVVLGGIIGITSDDENEAEPEVTEEEAEEVEEVDEEPEVEDAATEDETEEPQEETAALSDDDIETLRKDLEDDLEAEQEFGDMFYLDDFDYDSDANRINATIDMQQDPLPDTKEDVAEWAETWNWSMVEANELEEDFNATVTLVTEVDDGEYILWGHSTFVDGEYDFTEESGMQLYD